MRLATTAVTCLALTALTTTATAQAVRLVDAQGTRFFATIQAGIDAADDDAVLLVSRGDYDGFTIHGKGVTILTLPGHSANIHSKVVVEHLPAGKHVRLQGLHIRPTDTNTNALTLTFNQGSVRVDRCFLIAAWSRLTFACIEPGEGGHGALIQSCSDVVFRDCSLEGGDGYWGYAEGPYPGHAMAARGSDVAAYGCSLIGGVGGDGWDCGRDGGRGLDALHSDVYLVDCNIEGGPGGNTHDKDGLLEPGDGGDGILAGLGSHTIVADSALAGGPPGYDAYGFPAQSGPPIRYSNGTAEIVNEAARRFAGNSLISDDRLLSLRVEGVPGDRVFANVATAPAFELVDPATGIWLTAPPPLHPDHPLGVVPASGTLYVDVSLPALAPGELSRRLWLQGFVTTAGGDLRLGGALDLTLLNRDVGPDCNSTGVQDFVELAEHEPGDCDDNLIPDDCDIANGSQVDCNKNGVPDECDLANGSSKDVNGNGIPDECESGVTWWVDDDAGPGGNGSQSAPFQRVNYAFDVAVSGDTIMIRDGYYTLNSYDNDFEGRAMIVRSENGPDNCTIDCIKSGRGFLFRSGEGADSVLSGITITRGQAVTLNGQGAGLYIKGSSPTIEDCIVENNRAWSSGGGIYLEDSNALIRDCVIRRNRAINGNGTSGQGGGIDIDNSSAKFYDCLIVGNYARLGGGALVTTSGLTTPLVLRGCTIASNLASTGGGLFLSEWGSGEKPTLLENCLLYGNRAMNDGGAIHSSTDVQLDLINCSVVHNSALDEGGGLRLVHRATIANSIFWGNQAASGAEMLLGKEASIAYCNIEGGQAGIETSPNTVLHWGPGNIDADPRFTGLTVGPLKPRGRPYELGPGSPCLDAGDNLAVPRDWLDIDGDGNTQEPVPWDLSNTDRFVDDPHPDTGNGTAPIVDMGCLERQP